MKGEEKRTEEILQEIRRRKGEISSCYQSEDFELGSKKSFELQTLIRRQMHVIGEEQGSLEIARLLHETAVACEKRKDYEGAAYHYAQAAAVAQSYLAKDQDEKWKQVLQQSKEGRRRVAALAES